MSIVDALGMGIGFTLALLLLSFVREVLGNGTITLFAVGSFDGVIKIPFLSKSPVRIIGLAAGALLVMGYLKALFNYISMKRGQNA